MTNRKSIASNSTGLSYCAEDANGLIPSERQAPGVNVWNGLEPNSYSSFGANVTLTARSPISADRQQKKGTITGQSVGAGFASDLTPTNLTDLLSGFMFADVRRKGDFPATASTAGGFTVTADATAIKVGDLVAAASADNAATNVGLHVAIAGSDADTLAVTGLAVDALAYTIKRVGFEFAAGDASIDATVGGLPALVTVAKDLTELGITPGEIVYLGGDAAGNQFASTINSGWCRVLSVAAHRMVFDKTDFEMGDDAGAGKSIRLFFGDVLKNEVGTLIASKTYRLERTLGAPDRASPNLVQAEYIAGAMCDTLKLTVPEKKLITADLTFTGADYTTRTAALGPLAGTRPATGEEDAYNSAGDVKAVRLAVYPSPGLNTSAPDPLFAIVNSFDMTINNNLSENNAVGYVGAAEIIPGMFQVSGSLSAYFATVEATQAIRDSADVTLHFACWKKNKGVAVDFPMLALGKGEATVAANKAIMLPIDAQASTGAKYNAALDHTLLMVFFDYLPNAAGVRTM